MTGSRLLLRNLAYHWRANLAVLLGVAVGTTVLTGALLIGDSQRGSLYALAERRLMGIDQALITTRFFRDELAGELAGDAKTVSPVLLLQGSVSSTARDKSLSARKVTILGVDDRFRPGLFAEDEVAILLNSTVARTLEVRDGDEVTLHLQKQKDNVPRESLLGRKDASDVEQTITLKARILPPDAEIGEFSLIPSPQAPRNAYVPLAFLQQRLDLEGRVNALLASGVKGDLQAALTQRLTLKDWDLTLRPSKQRNKYLSLESRRLILDPTVERAALELDLPAAPTFVYMANNLAGMDKGVAAAVAALAPSPMGFSSAMAAYYGPLQVPYSSVAGVDLDKKGSVEEEMRKLVPKLGRDDILLVNWDGNPMTVKVDDRVMLSYFLPDDGGRLEEKTAVFTVKGVVPMTGAFDDRGLVPQVRGITDRLPSEWDAPFPLDRSRIRRVDDLYWQRHGATPKAFISLERARELWGSRFGDLTSIRFDTTSGTLKAEDIGSRLLAKLKPEEGGFVFEKVRENAMRASGGGTDFAMLFLAFSFFLILSALLLVGLLYRLSLDRRAAEVGVLIASGYPLKKIRRLLLTEGVLLALLGGIVGSGAAIVYSGILVDRLRSWWPGGLDAATLSLHVTPLSLAIGYVSALLVSVLTILWVIRALGRMTPRSLIQGQTTDETSPLQPHSSRRTVWVAAIATVGAIGCLVGGNFVQGHEARAGTFFGSGMLLLVAGLSALSLRMRSPKHGNVGGQGATAVARLGVRNASRHPSRSLLTAGLLAAAAFLLVGVESFRREPGKDYLRKDAGSGGFALLAESDLPVFQDLNSEAGRAEMLAKLRVRWQEEKPAPSQKQLDEREQDARTLLASVTVVPFRVHGGDDASCLNLYQPGRPTLMGVSDVLIDAGGFAFGSTIAKEDNPWKLLRAEGEEVPVFGEQNTVVWMLKSGLGKTLTVSDGAGQSRDLKLAGLLQDSVFQNGLLMSERRFLSLYPDAQGYRFFLLRVDPDRAGKVKELLQAALWDRGFEITSTEERLASFLAVENMYLSTFQALGGMGLLLGTLGLAVVLLRSVWERRGELALLRALGYRRGTLGWLVLAENGFLLLLGLGLGTFAALVSVAPHALGSGGHIAWAGLLGMLGLSLAAGLLASTIATAVTVRAALIPALRRE